VAVDPAGWSTREGDPCDDANPCTEQSTCLEGRCVGLPKACDDGEWCTLDRCEPGTGACLHDPREGECDDGDPCTLGDLCEAGRCLPGPGALPCDDGDTCTINDTCTAGTCVGTNTCSNQTALCAPAAGATALVTCLALLTLQLSTRRHRPPERPKPNKR